MSCRGGSEDELSLPIKYPNGERLSRASDIEVLPWPSRGGTVFTDRDGCERRSTGASKPVSSGPLKSVSPIGIHYPPKSAYANCPSTQVACTVWIEPPVQCAYTHPRFMTMPQVNISFEAWSPSNTEEEVTYYRVTQKKCHPQKC